MFLCKSDFAVQKWVLAAMANILSNSALLENWRNDPSFLFLNGFYRIFKIKFEVSIQISPPTPSFSPVRLKVKNAEFQGHMLA